MCGPSDLSPLQFLALIYLNKKPTHGYELFKVIDKRFGKRWKLKTGAIYKSLSKLVEKWLY